MKTKEEIREEQHLLRCAIAFVSDSRLRNVGGESRVSLAHKLRVMLAADPPEEIMSQAAWDSDGAPLNIEAAARDLVNEEDRIKRHSYHGRVIRKFLKDQSCF